MRLLEQLQNTVPLVATTPGRESESDPYSQQYHSLMVCFNSTALMDWLHLPLTGMKESAVNYYDIDGLLLKKGQTTGYEKRVRELQKDLRAVRNQSVR
jgi:hypothetical protein